MKEFKWLREEFVLNRNERRAIVFLSICFVLTMLININTLNNNTIYNKLKISDLKSNNEKDYVSNNNKLRNHKKVNSKKKYNYSKGTINNLPEQKKHEAPFKLTHKIDPNNPKEEDLLKLGLSSFAVQNWRKYIDSGAKIFSIDQVKKIYGLDEKDIIHLEAHLLFSSKEKKDTLNDQKWDQKTIDSKYPIYQSIEINTADIGEWTKISGIGDVLSKRIIKFKEALGGFNSIEQVGEVYGISDSLYQAIENRLEIIPVVSKININSISYENLKRHPYINSKQAKIICRYILQNGPLKSIADFKKIKAIDEKTTERVEPYLNYFVLNN